VPEQPLEGLVYEELLPVAWTPGSLIEGLPLARINADDVQLLGAEASLDEVRVHDSLKDESPALIHELQRLEYKINILLRLTSELSLRDSGLPSADKVRLGARAMEWFGERAPAVGSTGILAVYINPALPQPVKMPAVARSERTVEGARGTLLEFSGISEAVVDLLEKLIFRHHRRLVAGAKISGG
jgi:Atypical PilZ domain, cyclic di-GMP receptor